jgi:CRP-like cAMP-binding protein
MEHHYAATSGIAVLPERRAALRSTELEPPPASRYPALADASLWNALLGGASLHADDVELLARLAYSRGVTAGQGVINRSSNATTLVALRSGEVALGFRTTDGTFRTERIVRGPAWLDLSSAWLAGPHAMDAQALGPATVIELPREALEARLADHPDLAQRLIQGLAREVQALAVNTHELMHKDAPARLAQWLFQRCEPLEGAAGAAGQAVVRLRERKRDVASQLAITPETLSRLMRSFTRQGVIEVSGYSVRVIDPAALGRLAQA